MTAGRIANRLVESSQGSCRAVVALLLLQLVLLLLLVSGPRKEQEAPKHGTRATLVWVLFQGNASGSTALPIQHPRWQQSSNPCWTWGRKQTLHISPPQQRQHAAMRHVVGEGGVNSTNNSPGSTVSSSRQVLQSPPQQQPPKVTLQELMSRADVRSSNGSLQVKLPAVTVPSSPNGPKQDTQLPAVAVSLSSMHRRMHSKYAILASGVQWRDGAASADVHAAVQCKALLTNNALSL